MSDKKQYTIGVRIDEPTRQQLQEIADHEESSISTIARKIIKRGLKDEKMVK